MKAQEKLDLMIEQAQAKVVELQNLKSDVAVELQAMYDKGFSDGAASVGSNVVYTEEEYQNGIANAVAPLNQQILEFQAAIEQIPVHIQNAVEEAKAQLKSELLAEYEAAQNAENQAENDFKNKLLS